MAKNTVQRAVIWIIAIVMTVGTLGAYFIVILESGNANKKQEASIKALKSAAFDPTAYKVDGDVTELKIEDLAVGTGVEVKDTDTVKVHYKGTTAQTQIKFDSSYDKGEPATLELGNGIIVGFKEGVVGMKVGGKRRIIIPSDKAYGAAGDGYLIGANEDLVFEVELIDVNPAN